MSTYRYTGKHADGSHVEGTLTASDPSDLELRLLNRGINLEKSALSFDPWQRFVLQRFRRSEVTRITRQISLLLKSQISVLESLQLACEQVNDKALRQVFETIIRHVEGGRSVAQALGDYPFLFDKLYVSMVEAGELSGKLDFAFDTVATYREKYEQVTKKVKSALAYPALVVLVAILVVFALVLYIVPVFSSMYENFGAELPVLTGKVVAASAFLRESVWYWLMAIAALGGLTVAGSNSLSVRTGIDRYLLRVPLLKTLLVKIITARYCRTMGSLLNSGVDILAGLQIAARTTGNLHAGKQLQPVELALAQGKSLTESLEACGLFPKAMLRLTASGEKTGQLGEMLTRAADYYEGQTETELATLTTLVEPIIIVLLGVFIAFVLITIYLPLFDLVGQL